MGITLFYGYAFNETEPFWKKPDSPGVEHPDWESCLEIALGIQEASWQSASRVRAKVGVEILVCSASHDSDEFTLQVAVSKSQRYFEECREAHKLKPLLIGDDWDEKLAHFCNIMGIRVGKRKPGWFVAEIS